MISVAGASVAGDSGLSGVASQDGWGNRDQWLPVFYLENKQGAEAAAEFQKVMDYREALAPLPYLSLAKLGQARAYALTGDAAKSRTVYQDFFTIWKDADPDIPILKQAKAEYAKLQ